MRYDEVRVALSAAPEGRFKVKLSTAWASPVEESFELPAGVDAEELYREWFESFSPPASPAALRAIAERRRVAGVKLFEALFASAAPSILEKVTVLEDRLRSGNSGVPRGLRVRLILGDALSGEQSDAAAMLPVSSLPHELIIPPGQPRYLARRPYISIVRTIGVAEVAGPLSVSGSLRVLLVSAQPKGPDALGWDKEVARIKDGLAARTETTVEVLEHASFEATLQCLRRGGFHVLHFIGHGDHDAESGEWYLLFEEQGTQGTRGARQPVLAEQLADRLGNLPLLRLAVFNACHTGQLAHQAGGNPLAGIAAAVSASGVPAVIGMQLAVTDSAAIDFASAFYGALREGEPIESALADGRSAIDISSPEWATPVLYLRGETSELFDFEVKPNGPVLRGEGPRELRLGIRTLVESPRFPDLSRWAKKLEATSEKLLALEEFFAGRFIIDPASWNGRILPRLHRFLADAVEQDRPLALSLAAHGTVAFAAGYYFHTKTATKITLQQVTSGTVLRWSEQEGGCPQGVLWECFEDQVIDPDVPDVAVAVAITQSTAEAARSYVARRETTIGRLVCATIAGGPGKDRVVSGAHAHQLAWQLQQWLKDHTGDRNRRRLHLFISAPNGFLFFFGQLAKNLGRLCLYEFDFEA
ncbi:MAG TPA: SAVED domain-containing protein, partial [Thermoanaerobaculia bacterium]|nr:SAVED domain-containing protein [Thermoanaerobaculia bacterium]